MNQHFYLFLDADGVLHPMDLRIRGMTLEEMKSTAARSLSELQLLAGVRGFVNASDELPLSRLPLLEQTIRPFLAQIEIVISSSWRLQKTALKQLLDCMSDDVRERVIGVTPKRLRMGDCRPDEIRAWLEKHGKQGVTAIVLDDDSPHGNRTRFENLGIWIQIDPVKAFGDDHAAQLTLILSNPEGVR